MHAGVRPRTLRARLGKLRKSVPEGLGQARFWRILDMSKNVKKSEKIFFCFDPKWGQMASKWPKVVPKHFFVIFFFFSTWALGEAP